MKLLVRILIAFLLLTAVMGFFVGDYLSRENDTYWEDHKHKGSQVTAAILPVEEAEKIIESNIAPLVDDKDSRVLRIESLRNSDKQLPTVPADNMTGAVTLMDLIEFFGKPTSVHPSRTDCGIEDAHIYNFKNSVFKKRQADYFVQTVQISGSKIELKTPRLLLNQDTTLETFKQKYADKIAVQDLVRITKAGTDSELVPTTAVKKKNIKPQADKAIWLNFTTSSNANTQWVLEFNKQGLLSSLKLQELACAS